MSRFGFGAGLVVALVLIASAPLVAAPATASTPDKKPDSDSETPDGRKFEPFKPEATTSTGTVTVDGQSISYQSIAGTFIVHPQDWDDVPRDPNTEKGSSASGEAGHEGKNPTAEASMFYVAYFKNGGGARPVTFVYNGGPGSATLWLHMGAFGPRRIVTATDAHTAAAPYSLVNNASSLLDATDLVFIDAPGTGFSRIAGKDKEKAFFGVDQDAYAFADFIAQFLSKYGRWNSPKYLFGESYGTPRSAVLINQLESDRSIDFNGVILLSQILNFDLSPDRPTGNPGIDVPYQTVLPTYAATAWYHQKLPGEHKNLEALLAEVEQFAMGDYARALAAGSDLNVTDRAAIAEKLHQYTGLSVDYILKADLRIDGGEFRQNLQGSDGMTTGRLDTRFSGPDIDPLSQRADYDPQSAALSSAYVSAFNEYVRKDLHYGAGKLFKPSIPTFRTWNFQHQLPGQTQQPASSRQGSNVMPDLANAMKLNPNLKVQLNAGYFDLATPFYQGVYEMHHLPMPASLQANIEYKFYDSGHMVYAKDASLKLLHENVAGFIRRTSNLGK
ncbi:MAG: peptidase serine carboxypeptidase [Gammaproteobacteria bacterium]|jgi:carboxypeptidase C (cathepsin A)|nr:peptidase serine carboxypeptidase [Gammaproteobacteria bacterium]